MRIARFRLKARPALGLVSIRERHARSRDDSSSLIDNRSGDVSGRPLQGRGSPSDTLFPALGYTALRCRSGSGLL